MGTPERITPIGLCPTLAHVEGYQQDTIGNGTKLQTRTVSANVESPQLECPVLPVSGEREDFLGRRLKNDEITIATNMWTKKGIYNCTLTVTNTRGRRRSCICV